MAACLSWRRAHVCPGCFLATQILPPVAVVGVCPNPSVLHGRAPPHHSSSAVAGCHSERRPAPIRMPPRPLPLLPFLQPAVGPLRPPTLSQPAVAGCPNPSTVAIVSECSAGDQPPTRRPPAVSRGRCVPTETAGLRPGSACMPARSCGTARIGAPRGCSRAIAACPGLAGRSTAECKYASASPSPAGLAAGRWPLAAVRAPCCACPPPRQRRSRAAAGPPPAGVWSLRGLQGRSRRWGAQICRYQIQTDASVSQWLLVSVPARCDGASHRLCRIPNQPLPPRPPSASHATD